MGVFFKETFHWVIFIPDKWCHNRSFPSADNHWLWCGLRCPMLERLLSQRQKCSSSFPPFVIQCEFSRNVSDSGRMLTWAITQGQTSGTPVSKTESGHLVCRWKLRCFIRSSIFISAYWYSVKSMLKIYCNNCLNPLDHVIPRVYTKAQKTRQVVFEFKESGTCLTLSYLLLKRSIND